MNAMDLANIKDPANVVPRPPRTSDSCRNLSSWVEEGIWGHRLWHRQTPWLLFLECLNIAEAAHRQNDLLTPHSSLQSIGYRLHQRHILRNLVFNNPSLCTIADSGRADTVLWDDWIKAMSEDSQPSRDYSYLRGSFARFGDLKMAVELLRHTAIEPSTNRRWSSRFLFPFGPHSLYEDLNITASGSSREYGNFGRTGELLYMMLSRSTAAPQLSESFSAFFSAATVQNRMVAKLLPQSSQDDLSDSRSVGYLPYLRHPAFDRLADDWLAILNLKLPLHDPFAHLVPLAAFHVLLYLLETASVWLGRSSLALVCEVIAPKMEFVRQRAIRSYLDNDGLPWAATERVIADFMTGPEWKASVEDTDLISESDRVDAAVTLLSEHLWLKEDDIATCASVPELQDRVLAKLRDKHDDNWSMIHSAYARQCGLASKRGTRNYRYAPTDSFLKTLVLANVSKRMEINEFLQHLFRKYHLVFGPDEAEAILPTMDYDEPAFQKNRARLEERLRSMGLLNRLSDGCAYVENPLLL